MTQMSLLLWVRKGRVKKLPESLWLVLSWERAWSNLRHQRASKILSMGASLLHGDKSPTHLLVLALWCPTGLVAEHFRTSSCLSIHLCLRMGQTFIWINIPFLLVVFWFCLKDWMLEMKRFKPPFYPIFSFHRWENSQLERGLSTANWNRSPGFMTPSSGIYLENL